MPMLYIILATYILLFVPSKSNSAPVRGDLAYKPTDLRIEQSQRRDVTQCVGRSWWLSRRCGQ